MILTINDKLKITALSLLEASACKTQNNNTIKKDNVENEISATGVITKVENGKDGYTAILTGNDGQQYMASISIAKLGKDKNYKQHVVGDKITVKGTFWKDSNGNINITVKELN